MKKSSALPAATVSFVPNTNGSHAIAEFNDGSTLHASNLQFTTAVCVVALGVLLTRSSAIGANVFSLTDDASTGLVIFVSDRIFRILYCIHFFYIHNLPPWGLIIWFSFNHSRWHF